MLQEEDILMERLARANAKIQQLTDREADVVINDGPKSDSNLWEEKLELIEITEKIMMEWKALIRQNR